MNPNEIISMMFSQVLAALSDLLSNDLVIVCLAILSILLILVGFDLIRNFLGAGLSDKETTLKAAYQNYQSNKGTWREDLYKKKYDEALSEMEEKPRKYL